MRQYVWVLLCVASSWVVLGGCGKSVKSWQKQILSQESADQRREGIVELMETRQGKSDAAVRLLGMLGRGDEDATVRSAAAQALGETGNPNAVEPLAVILSEDSDAQVRLDSAVSLGKVRGPEAVRVLMNRLREDPQDEVRAACARSLGEYPYVGVAQALAAALLADDFSIAFEAERSLEKLTGQSFQSSVSWHDWLRQNGDPFDGVRVVPEG